MTNEEFNRKMEFIVAQQSKFFVGIERLRERQEQTEKLLSETRQNLETMRENMAQTDRFIAESAEVVTRLANVTFIGFTEVNAKINALVDAQIRTAEAQQRTAEAQQRTENALKKLIDRARAEDDGTIN